MNNISPYSLLKVSFSTSFMYFLSCSTALAAPIAIHQSPLYLTSGQKANVLVILDNSNSMDEAANGAAIGSNSPLSKSEIARSAIRNLVTNYTNKINMGLMAYQQTGVNITNLSNSAYDASYDITDYDSSFTGPRNSSTKRYRLEKADDLGMYVYYNIALPYYHNGGSIGDTQYCYSTTANAFNNGEIPVEYDAIGNIANLNGPWDTYRCFTHKNGASNALGDITGGYNTFQNENFYFSTDSDLAQGVLDFGSRIASVQIGSAWFSNTSPGRGYLHIEIADLDSAQATALNSKLDTSQFITNGATNPTLPLQNAGLTPLEGTLLSAKDYFNGTTLPADEGGPTSPLSESCEKDFIALLTDGLPSINASGSATTDPAIALNDVASAATSLLNENVRTYMVGFALPAGTDPTTLDTIATAGGSGTAYLANDSVTLQAAFDNIFTDIIELTGASSSAATNSTSLSTDSYIYQARYSSADWSGELLAKPISLTGLISNTPLWNAATQLNSQPASNRIILTYNRDNNDGMPFKWPNINSLTDTTAKDKLNTHPISHIADGLGADRVNFIRGGTGGASSGLFRQDRLGKLGDIIHSTPYYVTPPDAGYNDIDMPGYTTFHDSQSARSSVLYAGANDGMLHAFEATTGHEILAYIPRSIYPYLTELTAQNYGTSPLHRYFVDGAPMVADANISGWKTILAGGLNAGGQGIYALDITDPSSFSEANASNIVLWEFTDEDDADLGYTFIQPTINSFTNQSAQIAKMANGKWAVIIGNGYNNTEADGNVSTTGHAYLYILFIEGGIDGTWTLNTDYIKLDTGEGSTITPNGLATPTPIDTDGDGDIDTIYAGDLNGNLWKFDVSNPTPSLWHNPLPLNTALYTAKDVSNTPQPITTAVLVTPHPDSGYILGIATGKYLELSDLSDTQTQTLYGIYDNDLNNATTPSTSRSQLIEQTILMTQTIGAYEYRMSSQNDVDYITKKGWYMDLPESGERVDVNPLLRPARFVFTTRTPETTVCSSGGSSWIIELDFLTGGRLDLSPFDVNGDGSINQTDWQTVTIDSIETQIPVTAIRQQGEGGMLATPTVLSTDSPTEEYKVLSSSNGTVSSILESVPSGKAGRLTWQEIR